MLAPCVSRVLIIFPTLVQNLASQMEIIGGRSRLYICTISHLLAVKKKKPNHFARSKFDHNFTTGLNKLSRIVGSRHTLQCLCNMLLGSLSPVFQNTRERIGPEQNPGFLQGLITSEAIEARLETIVLIVKHFAQDFPFLGKHPINAMLCEPQLTCRFILVHLNLDKKYRRTAGTKLEFAFYFKFN